MTQRYQSQLPGNAHVTSHHIFPWANGTSSQKSASKKKKKSPKMQPVVCSYPACSTYYITAGETPFMVSSLHAVKYLHPLPPATHCSLPSSALFPNAHSSPLPIISCIQKATSQSSLLFFRVSVSNSLLWQSSVQKTTTTLFLITHLHFLSQA